MPLVIAPFFQLNSQYRPNRFVVSLASANPLVLAQASIVVDLVGVTSISKQPYLTIGATYYFEFDVAKVLQQYSQPKSQSKTSIFPNTLGTTLNQSNADIHTRVALIVSYYYNDPVTGLLTQDATIDTIPIDYPAIAGTRQTRDWNNMGLADYVMDAFVGQKQFLTNFKYFGTDARRYEICPTENHYLTFVPATSNTFRVTTLDSAGATIQQGLATLTPDATLVPTTIGSGMVNLAAQAYFSGAVNMANPNIASYYIEVGQAFLFGGSWFFQNASYPYIFLVNRQCCEERRVRLHWMNRLGGADSYTFSSKKTISEKSKSETAQKPLSWGYSLPTATSYDKGQFKIQTEVVKEYEVEGTFYDETDGNWIAELLTSPEVYMETADGLVSVVIEDSTMKIVESDELLNLTIKFVESNYISVQSN